MVRKTGGAHGESVGARRYEREAVASLGIGCRLLGTVRIDIRQGYRRVRYGGTRGVSNCTGNVTGGDGLGRRLKAQGKQQPQKAGG